MELATERPPAFAGLSAIPWSRMVFWCEYHGLGREISRHTIRVLGTVDSIMIRRANAKSKVPEPKKGRR